MSLSSILQAVSKASCDLARTIDDVAIALRRPLKGLAWFGVAFQGAIVAGTIKFADGSHWPNAIGMANIVLAYFTIRGVEDQALARAADAKQVAQP